MTTQVISFKQYDTTFEIQEFAGKLVCPIPGCQKFLETQDGVKSHLAHRHPDRLEP